MAHNEGQRSPPAISERPKEAGRQLEEVVVAGIRFGPIEHYGDVEHNPSWERVAPGRYEFAGEREYPGLIMAGRYGATAHRRCSACDALVRGCNMRRHASAHQREGGR
jgi:hypothetical protein